MRIRNIFLTMTLSTLLAAGLQTATGQKVRLDFPRTVFRDEFVSDSGQWKEISNASNLLLMQHGEYILQRKTTGSYSTFPAFRNVAAPYCLSASLRIDEGSDPESGIGMILMSQQSGNGGFTIEFNARKEYRIRQLVGVSYRLLTGDPHSLGWIRFESLNGKSAWNTLQVRTADRNYDLFINGIYVTTFSDPNYFSGDIGVMIGPMSSGRVDWIDVRMPEERQEEPAIVLPTPADDPRRLQEELARLRAENQALRDSLQRCCQPQPVIRKPAKNGKQE